MKTLIRTIATAALFIRNKFIAILLQLALMYAYTNLPQGIPIPFAELLYAAIMANGTVIIGLLIRLLVWPEVAAYAERGGQHGLNMDLQSLEPTVSLKHYWYATTVSFLIAIACFATLSH